MAPSEQAIRQAIAVYGDKMYNFTLGPLMEMAQVVGGLPDDQRAVCEPVMIRLLADLHNAVADLNALIAEFPVSQ